MEDHLRRDHERWRELMVYFTRLYYKGDPARLSCCTLTLHALLHIAHDIRQAGPVWVYWAFAMERFCGHLQRAIKSRRFPWSNLDHFIELDSLLTHVIHIHHLDTGDALDISPQPQRGRYVMEKQDVACKFPLQAIFDAVTY